MEAPLAQATSPARIQHERIRTTAAQILLTRLLEGIACWGILILFYSRITVSPWLVHLNFTLYGIANCLLYFPHRRQRMTRQLVWLDIIVNLLPMAIGAFWSGGIYSPILAAFVIKIGSYGLIYSAETGVRSLLATAVFAAALWLCERAGFAPSEGIAQVSPLIRQQITLAFGGLIFIIGCGGALRFFRELADREHRLADALREQERLYQQSLQHQKHLQQLSRRIMQVSEVTMQRVSHELHDDLGQALTAVKMDLGRIDRELPPESSLRSQVQEAREQIGTVLQSVRNLSQLLRPAVLDDLGLVPAMQSYIRRFEERTGIGVTLTAPAPETRFPQPIEVTLYRVLQETLTNVARHAQAQHVTISLDTRPGTANLRITDDGCGFDATTYLGSPPNGHGMGVLGMRERAEVYGGHLMIESQPGTGTSVQLDIPLSVSADGTEGTHAEDQRLAG